MSLHSYLFTMNSSQGTEDSGDNFELDVNGTSESDDESEIL